VHTQCRPGFDWLFAYPIAGLITAWGGANSHMAIRAGELDLPAVIGAGEVLYRRWSSSAATASGLCESSRGGSRLKLVAMSQGVTVYPDRNERRDTLDQRLSAFLSSVGYLPVPVPNGLVPAAHSAIRFWIPSVRG
jgi:hypothetical protein